MHKQVPVLPAAESTRDTEIPKQVAEQVPDFNTPFDTKGSLK